MPTRVIARNRVWLLFAVIATIGVGLATRRFPEFVPDFLGKYPGDALWALMVFFGWAMVYPVASSVRLASLALAVACAVEVLKLYQAPWIIEIRRSTIGHLVFGHVFSWQNFIAYAIGVSAGVAGEYFFVRPFGQLTSTNE